MFTPQEVEAREALARAQRLLVRLPLSRTQLSRLAERLEWVWDLSGLPTPDQIELPDCTEPPARIEPTQTTRPHRAGAWGKA